MIHRAQTVTATLRRQSRCLPTAPRIGLVAAALCLAVVVVACTPAPASSPTAALAQPTQVLLHLRDYALEPMVATAAGGRVALAVTNDGPSVHNVTIRDAGGTVLVASKDLAAGGSQVLSTRIDPGDYVLFCSVPGHEALGMRGTLTVTGP